MNLQTLVDEKIALGKKLIEENEWLQYMTFYIEDINPSELEQFAKESKREVTVTSGNKLQVICPYSHPVVVFIMSKPVKINTNIQYELI